MNIERCEQNGELRWGSFKSRLLLLSFRISTDAILHFPKGRSYSPTALTPFSHPPSPAIYRAPPLPSHLIRVEFPFQPYPAQSVSQ